MTALRSRFARGFGLRARMTASYVVVTAAVVVLVEALAAVLVIPNLSQQADLTSRVRNTASHYADQYGAMFTKMAASGVDPSSGAGAAALKDAASGALVIVPAPGRSAVQLRPGEERSVDDGVLIPQVERPLSGSGPMSLAVVLGLKGQVLASSYPGRYPVGSPAADWLPRGWEKGSGNVSELADGRVAWASQAIFDNPKLLGDPAAIPQDGKGGKGFVPATLGYVYVQVPVPADPPSLTALVPLLQMGAVFLLATIPVGVVFGLLTTRGVTRRLRRLAAGTVGFAGGDFSHRVPESGPDEVGQLERHFNGMAERLSASIAEQQTLAERNARLAERSRITRELHDSISQDLFSITALVGGLRKALPPGAPVQPQLEALSETAASTIQEMRALLLELRPTALEEKGLVPALTDLCEAYEVRIGVRVRNELGPVSLDPAAEQAVFRIAQEGLSNAVRHSEADGIEVRLRQSGPVAELTVADNGRGFDRERTGDHGLGLKLMGERVRELGGSLAIESGLGRGTVLRVRLPAAAA
jgi:signal transduction histidine kinase